MKYLDDRAKYMNSPCLPEAEELASLIKADIVTDSVMERIWSATTNVRSCGGLNKAAQKVIYRALKVSGYKYWLLLENDPDGRGVNSWGLSKRPPTGAVTGYSLNHAAHKLGGGNSDRGWHIYWNPIQ